MKDAKKILIKEYIRSKDIDELREEVYFGEWQTDDDLINAMEEMGYDLQCNICGEDLVFHDTDEEWFCLSCDEI